jgi:hypothetical protein
MHTINPKIIGYKVYATEFISIDRDRIHIPKTKSIFFNSLKYH